LFVKTLTAELAEKLDESAHSLDVKTIIEIAAEASKSTTLKMAPAIASEITSSVLEECITKQIPGVVQSMSERLSEKITKAVMTTEELEARFRTSVVSLRSENEGIIERIDNLERGIDEKLRSLEADFLCGRSSESSG